MLKPGEMIPGKKGVSLILAEETIFEKRENMYQFPGKAINAYMFPDMNIFQVLQEQVTFLISFRSCDHAFIDSYNKQAGRGFSVGNYFCYCFCLRHVAASQAVVITLDAGDGINVKRI